MNCEQVERDDILGAYLAGKLPEAERDQFEEHFFGCERCLEQVEAGRIAREALLRATLKKPSLRWWIPLAAAAAVIVVGVAIWRVPGAPERRRPMIAAVTAKASPSSELLARFEPPIYRASTLRGAEKSDRAFRDAMKLYTAGDFAGAAVGLKGAGTVEARYYLGISELLAGNRTEGIENLMKVIAAGDTPYRSEARFYSAKGLIGAGDAVAARGLLEQLVKDGSELGPQAEETLRQLGR